MATNEQIREHIERTLDVDVRSGYGSEARVLERLREQVRDEFRKAPPVEREAEVERWVELGGQQRAARHQGPRGRERPGPIGPRRAPVREIR